ncbi:MAG: TolC family protein [Vampirovibrionales bacterium]|nr:TolC family protein [Vampirovibrionales bacterium]
MTSPKNSEALKARWVKPSSLSFLAFHLLAVVLVCMPLATAKMPDFHFKKIKKASPDLSVVTLEKTPPRELSQLTQITVNVEKGLQLRDTLQWVKQTHPDLRLARLKLQQSQAKFLATQGAFDPKLSGGFEFRQYNNSSAPGKQKDAFLSDNAVSLLTRYGLVVEGGYRNNRGDLSSSVSPVGQGGEIYTNFILPLLRYRGTNPFSVAEKQAALELKRAALDLQFKELQVQQKTGEAYWEWVASKRLLETSIKLLDLGKTRVSQVRKRVNAGDLPEIAFVEVQKEVQKRQGQVAKDTLNLQKATIKLSLLLWNQEPKDGRLDVLPQWLPKEVHLPKPDVLDLTSMKESGKVAMLKMHPRLLSFPISKEIAQLDIDLAKQAFLPKLDAIVSPSYQMGQDGIGAAIKAGIKYELPLRYRTATGKLRYAELDLQSIDVQYLFAYQELSAGLEQILAELEAQWGIYNAASGEWKTAQALEKGERTSFEMGDSTLFVVNIRERETADAYRKVIESEQDFHQAVLRYLVLTTQI